MAEVDSASLPGEPEVTTPRRGLTFAWWPVMGVIIALGCGVTAFWGAQRYLSSNATALEREWSERFQNIEVIVAARALPAGHRLAADDLAKRALPEAMISTHALTIEQLEQVIGQQLLVAMAVGEPVSRAALATEEVRSLAARLQPGSRAVTVPVDDVTSQAGLVRPNDHVDLMLAEERSEQGARCVEVTPLIEAVQVLATGQAQGEGRNGADEQRRGDDYRYSQYSTLTLDVTPVQAQQIAAALRIGDLIPVLRGQGDLGVSNLPSFSAGLPQCAQAKSADTAPPRKSRPTQRVELWVGGQVPPLHKVHEFIRTEMPAERSIAEDP